MRLYSLCLRQLGLSSPNPTRRPPRPSQQAEQPVGDPSQTPPVYPNLTHPWHTLRLCVWRGEGAGVVGGRWWGGMEYDEEDEAASPTQLETTDMETEGAVDMETGAHPAVRRDGEGCTCSLCLDTPSRAASAAIAQRRPR